MSGTKHDERGLDNLLADILLRSYSIASSDLNALQEAQALLGDPRVRVEVTPSTESHAAMMAAWAG